MLASGMLYFMFPDVSYRNYAPIGGVAMVLLMVLMRWAQDKLDGIW